MKKLTPMSYRNRFFKHVWRFLGNVASKSELAANQVIAVSGGVDSMTLLWVAHELWLAGKIGPLRAIFIHHHTRPSQSEDQRLVEKFCAQLGVDLTVLHTYELSTEVGNFEARARKIRRDLCLRSLNPGELLWLGHHLDDSYEWNFMQRHRSSSQRVALGIPVRNGPIVRPFLCVTKSQLLRLALLQQLPFLEDPTNQDVHHDRNYVRNVIVPVIRKRYPKYLKHYAYFANHSAVALKVSILSQKAQPQVLIFKQGAALTGSQYSPFEVQELIHRYSNTDRGEIIITLDKMLQAIHQGKKGPFHFSGGVEAYYTTGLLMIYRQKMKNNDLEIAKALRSLPEETLSSVPNLRYEELLQAWDKLTQSPDALMHLPGLLLVLEKGSICKTLNTSVFDPLFPEVSQWCRERGHRFTTFQKCLDVWKRKEEKLPRTLRILPLSNLSHLFTSQR
jgi:tRNA(Ile)-lysidine synthetase-like protein